MKGLLCRLVPLTEAELGTVAKWLSPSECEALVRGTSSTLLRESQYASLEAEGRRAAIVTDVRGTTVGIVHWWRLDDGVYEVGGATGDERLWNTGIGIEAALLVIDYLFEVENCRRIEFTTGLHNNAVINIGLGDGMTVEAICRNYFATTQGNVPAVKSGMTREEYQRPYPHYQPRVGRHLDAPRHEARTRALSRRIDVHGIANRLRSQQP
ncbi:GNAT family N-acetyltransferase [Streptomyces sp. ISL-10]|uniref:GNAT family N-acetyltransferase n=1 Tax=Streptomyces sp. ISL-10 TaxID=2819172 RepID=UPI001BEAC176|nr:GNAT family protein [Streptomyces sp. ISL-10]MBT2364801.1 GNAT family N-acetyltransferase [Streptomyces sp. ISL-10]